MVLKKHTTWSENVPYGQKAYHMVMWYTFTYHMTHTKCYSYKSWHTYIDMPEAVHIDLCVIEYSLVDTPTALKHGDEACLHIWHLTSNLSIASPNLSCELLTNRMNLLIKNVLGQFDFWPSKLHEKILTLLVKIRLSSLFS